MLKLLLQCPIGKPPAHEMKEDGYLFSSQHMLCPSKTCAHLKCCKEPPKYELLHPDFIVKAFIMPTKKLIKPMLPRKNRCMLRGLDKPWAHQRCPCRRGCINSKACQLTQISIMIRLFSYLHVFRLCTFSVTVLSPHMIRFQWQNGTLPWAKMCSVNKSAAPWSMFSTRGGKCFPLCAMAPHSPHQTGP